MQINDLIKQRRLYLKESQAEFGKRFGISHAAVSDIENGKVTHISTDMIQFVFQGVIKVSCSTCAGKGYIERRDPPSSG